MSIIYLKLLILFFCIHILSNAQKLDPIGFANTYTLSEIDGFPGFNYTTRAQINSAGKIYVKDFFGNFHITGNNFIKQIPGLTNLENHVQINLQPNNQIWLNAFERRSITIIKNDSVYKTIDFSNHNENCIYFDNSPAIYQLKQEKYFINISRFIDEKWVLLNRIPWDSNNKINRAYPVFQFNKNNYVKTIRPNNNIAYYLFDTVKNDLKYIATNPKHYEDTYPFYLNKKWEINSSLQQSFINYYFLRTGKKIKKKYLNSRDFELTFSWDINEMNSFLFKQNSAYAYSNYDSIQILLKSFVFESIDRVNLIQKNPNHPSFLLFTNNKPKRIFPYIKKYPNLFNHNSSANIFAITQDKNGNIWACSYENNISIIKPAKFDKGLGSKLIELPKQPYSFMNAAINFNEKLYFVGESNLGGILQYNIEGKLKKLKPQTPNGYYLYYAPFSKTIWMPSAEGPNYPIYTCSANDIETPFINWQKLDTTVGIKAFGFASITEDSLQRIWIGHPKKGFAVYNQKSKKAITYDLHKNQTPVGFISSITDKNGTVFMGSDEKGLWYYNDYSKPPTPENIHHIDHPLLNNTTRITGMTIYNNWLVLSCYNKICLLNLDSFHLKNKAIIKYLNPQEASLTSITEQNTMLVSKTDSTLWFSTSDMLYQWDIKTWLHISPFQVNLSTYLLKDSNRVQLNSNQPINIKAGDNSFDLVFEYLSPDCLPRYTRTALVKKGGSPIFSEPNLQSRFSFKNLTSDSYKFYIEVFEQDGSTSHYIYQFIINKFIWQQWWFWMLASFLFLIPLILWINGLRKEAIQQKIISQLNIVTLSSQFRPHFILNALNTIGADLINKPDAETVLSRLGESINLIFNQAQQKRITHTLKNEWVLIENLIDIHRIMYLPELQVEMPSLDWLEHNSTIILPVGLIEIMVENALLHGLRNKKTPPYIIKINAHDDDTNTYFKISDNGIGRANSMQLSSYKKHGTGTKNLSEIINILNKFNKNKIDIKYADNNLESDENCGTIITILIPKNYFYEY